MSSYVTAKCGLDLYIFHFDHFGYGQLAGAAGHCSLAYYYPLMLSFSSRAYLLSNDLLMTRDGINERMT
jgi:hypothetical protein